MSHKGKPNRASANSKNTRRPVNATGPVPMTDTGGEAVPYEPEVDNATIDQANQAVENGTPPEPIDDQILHGNVTEQTDENPPEPVDDQVPQGTTGDEPPQTGDSNEGDHSEQPQEGSNNSAGPTEAAQSANDALEQILEFAADNPGVAAAATGAIIAGVFLCMNIFGGGGRNNSGGGGGGLLGGLLAGAGIIGLLAFLFGGSVSTGGGADTSGNVIDPEGREPGEIYQDLNAVNPGGHVSPNSSGIYSTQAAQIQAWQNQAAALGKELARDADGNLLDENGEIITWEYEKDENGKVKTDENGNRIMLYSGTPGMVDKTPDTAGTQIGGGINAETAQQIAENNAYQAAIQQSRKEVHQAYSVHELDEAKKFAQETNAKVYRVDMPLVESSEPYTVISDEELEDFLEQEENKEFRKHIKRDSAGEYVISEEMANAMYASREEKAGWTAQGVIDSLTNSQNDANQQQPNVQGSAGPSSGGPGRPEQAATS